MDEPGKVKAIWLLVVVVITRRQSVNVDWCN